MKHLYVIGLFLFSINSFCQNALSGEWFLHYIEVDGIVQYSTIPNSYHQIYFQPNEYLGISCTGGYGATYVINDASTVTFSSFVTTLSDICPTLIEDTNFVSPYYYSVLNNPETVSDVLNFNITGTGSDETLTFTNSENNSAHYGRLPLVENRLPGTWYLHSVVTNGVENINQYNPTASISFNMSQGIAGALEFEGTVICNDFFGEYYLDGLDSLNSLYMSHTQIFCSTTEQDVFESAYWSTFQTGDSGSGLIIDYNIEGSGDDESLVLTNPNGDYSTYQRQVLSISDIDGQRLAVRILQNPVQDALVLDHLETVDDELQYEIYAIDGKQVSNRSRLINSSIAVDHLKSGLYFLSIYSNEGFHQNLKFIKE